MIKTQFPLDIFALPNNRRVAVNTHTYTPIGICNCHYVTAGISLTGANVKSSFDFLQKLLIDETRSSHEKIVSDQLINKPAVELLV